MSPKLFWGKLEKFGQNLDLLRFIQYSEKCRVSEVIPKDQIQENYSLTHKASEGSNFFRLGWTFSVLVPILGAKTVRICPT